MNSGLFCLDEENQSLIWLDGNAEDGSLSAAIEQMGIIGYWTYGDITAPEEETEAEGSSDAVPEGNSPDEEIQEEDSQELKQKTRMLLIPTIAPKIRKKNRQKKKKVLQRKTDAGKKGYRGSGRSARLCRIRMERKRTAKKKRLAKKTRYWLMKTIRFPSV